MKHKYIWKHKEANFGKPLRGQITGGTHITFELILKWKNNYIALRRPEAIPGHESPTRANQYPKGLLYFCHNLIRYGESIERCVKRIVKEQVGVGVTSWRVVDIESYVQGKDNQWAFTPHVIVELAQKPKVGYHGNHITEVVSFTKKNIPSDFGWWSKKDLRDFFNKFD